ncbi:hypothetical protein V2G26_006133 [Clonostachys chloroleuca]|uniref:Uncharacterized protein n=1 Tax=Clonostachys chloroleuca TaxID=1926264 RepID=A0AA35Q3M9_9HYPO|nr:unnamed protein product [Clonostachys chloroleuca]
MPEVQYGSIKRSNSDPGFHQSDASDNTATNTTPLQKALTLSDNHVAEAPPRRLSFALGRRSSSNNPSSSGNVAPTSPGTTKRKGSIQVDEAPPRKSLSYALRPQAEAYYDSRAATRTEFKRRGKTLEEYYDDNPELLPQLPFTWHHGNRRWRLWFFAFIVFVDASAVPIALYYGMKYAGDVQEYIIFIIVTTIWGGPTYLEFAIRTLRLMKKERFYRPLGTTNRWCADMLTWASALTITVVTTLFIVGSAPHDTWLRVVSMAAPSILWCYGGVLLAITLLYRFNIPAPFRISSTAKGGKVLPGVYYFIEDTLAVNGGCGAPYREALAARYRASPRFREMLYEQSLFWSIPTLIFAAILTVIAVIPQVPENWSYGVCWVAPFGFTFVWGLITITWCKARMVRERLEWEAGEFPRKIPSPSEKSVPVQNCDPVA